jgi:hypothetical protein
MSDLVDRRSPHHRLIARVNRDHQNDVEHDQDPRGQEQGKYAKRNRSKPRFAVVE